jgi:hypothetical protein
MPHYADNADEFAPRLGAAFLLWNREIQKPNHSWDVKIKGLLRRSERPAWL